MGLLQYKPKPWKPYVVGCIEHPDECRFSLHEQDQSRRLLQQLTPLSDPLLLTTLPSSVILFIQTNGSHRNWLLCSLCSLGERGHAHSPPGFVLSNMQGWFILLYSPSPAHEAFSFDLRFSSCNSARPKHFGWGCQAPLISSVDTLESGAVSVSAGSKEQALVLMCRSVHGWLSPAHHTCVAAQHKCIRGWGSWPELPQPSLALAPLCFAEG